MALIAALLPDEADRRSLDAAARTHRVVWARSWRELSRLVRRRAVTAAVADLRAEPGKDGALRVYRFAQRYPLTPILVWGELDGRDLFRVGKAGAADVVLAADAPNQELVEELVGGALDGGLAELLVRRLTGRIGDDGLKLVRFAAERITEGVQVPDLAAALDISVSTLERRCESWGLTTPGRLILWLRVIQGLRWLLEPGRSVESVADQLAYSSGAAFRRAIKATVGGKPTPLRNRAGLDQAIEQFIAECPGVVAYQRLTEV